MELVPPLIVVALFALFGGLQALRRKNRVTFQQRLAAGKALLADGRSADAAASFGELARAAWLDDDARGWARFFEGSALMLSGELERAAEALGEAALRHAGGAQWEQARNGAASNLALLEALRGRIVESERWLQIAERGGGPQPVSQTPRAILDCRQGRFDQLAERLDGQWHRLEAVHTGRSMRYLRLVRAFAEGQRTSARDDAAVERWLSPLRPHRPGEFSWMGAGWPELKTFLDLRSLS